MNVPIELSFRGMEGSDELKARIQRGVERLDRMGEGIMSCRVAIDRHDGGRPAAPFHVRIEVTLPPDGDLVVHKDAVSPGGQGPTTLQTTLKQAFQAMERKVRSENEKRRYDIKTHLEPRAIVERVFHDEGYGFARTHDGEEVYFHEHSVLHGDFDRLTVGAEVRLDTEQGEKGVQATSVQIVSKPGARAGRGEDERPGYAPAGYEDEANP